MSAVINSVFVIIFASFVFGYILTAPNLVTEKDPPYRLLNDTNVKFVDRPKRNTANGCPYGKEMCDDGQCIEYEKFCNGTKECKDGSDETFARCWNSTGLNKFRCAYGALIDTKRVCDGNRDCADSSDERFYSGSWMCPKNYRPNKSECNFQSFTCNDGSCIGNDRRCDGVYDCIDGSDESIVTCTLTNCSSNMVRCKYGACVQLDAHCNGVVECADGSDESPDLCSEMTMTPTSTTIAGTTDLYTTSSPLDAISGPTVTKSYSLGSGTNIGRSGCTLPAFGIGSYKVEPNGGFGPGDVIPPFTVVTFNCGPNASLRVDYQFSLCLGNEQWTSEPICRKTCKALESLSVDYDCYTRNDQSIPCDRRVEEGGKAVPRCKPSYTSQTVLRTIRCEDGVWDYTVFCAPECGTVSPRGEILVVGGHDVEHGEFPWHVAIFEKNTLNTDEYTNLCGGSIVNEFLVISAAHCFYIDGVGKKAAEAYTIGAGKLRRNWDSNLEDPRYVQKIKVKSINIPEHFGGISLHYQADIALLGLEDHLVFSSLVMPVCINFDRRLEDIQLRQGSMGKVAGWGLTKEDGDPSEILKTTNLPFITFEECLNAMPYSFRPFLVTDKICAGWRNGTAVCKGDSGGGLVFPSSDFGTTRFYLRGIVSNSPLNDGKTSCRSNNYAAFTRISSYSRFISKIWSEHQPRR